MRKKCNARNGDENILLKKKKNWTHLLEITFQSGDFCIQTFVMILCQPMAP